MPLLNEPSTDDRIPKISPRIGFLVIGCAKKTILTLNKTNFQKFIFLSQIEIIG